MADWRDEVIAELRAELAAEREKSALVIAELRGELAAVRKENAELRKTVEKLRERLGDSSNNSSRPPSTDDKEARAQRKRKGRTGKKRGGQPGHERSTRPLVPIEKVSAVVPCIPERCDGCAAALSGVDPRPLRHQVWDLPKIEPIINEYQLHALTCGKCARVTRGSLPIGVPTRAFGPTVDAAVAMLLGVYRMSRRMVPDFLETFFGLSMALGSVVNCQKVVSHAVAVPAKEAHYAVQAAHVKYCDETGWRESGKTAFLWTVVTSTVTVFLIQARRTAGAARRALGKVHGLIGTDRHGAYNGWSDLHRQFCWAHLSRAFVKISERGGEAARIGDALLAEEKQMFIWWHRVRDGTLKRSSFRTYMKPLQDRVFALLEDATHTCVGTKTGRTCQKLLDRYDALWTFVYFEGIEPTNNNAERALRFAVILRKLSFGTQSRHGSRFIERMLTCHATLKQQGRETLGFLRAACEAALRGAHAPTLIPRTPSSPSLYMAA